MGARPGNLPTAPVNVHSTSRYNAHMQREYSESTNLRCWCFAATSLQIATRHAAHAVDVSRHCRVRTSDVPQLKCDGYLPVVTSVTRISPSSAMAVQAAAAAARRFGRSAKTAVRVSVPLQLL